MQTEFIPFTGDTHELQFKKSPAQQWFLGIYHRTSAPLLNAQKSFSNDSQGMYIVGPDGTSYGYTNDHDPSNIHACMNSALQQYKQHPPKSVTITDQEIQARFAITPAPTTSVVRVFSRIRPVPEGCTGLNKGVGRDYLWIYRDEVKAMLAAKVQPGQAIKMPDSLARRMARFHLLDNVRGTPDMWDAHEVKHLTFQARLVQDAGGVRTIAFAGTFAMQTNSEKKGYTGKVEGELAIRASDAQVVRFRAFSDGKAWGDGTYTPNAPKGRYTLQIAMVEAHDPTARIVPPEDVSTENSDKQYHHP